jgi:hypothetical protein
MTRSRQARLYVRMEFLRHNPIILQECRVWISGNGIGLVKDLKPHRHVELYEAFSKNKTALTTQAADVVHTRSALSAGFGD